MARVKGRFGRIRAPGPAGNETTTTLTQKSGSIYHISDIAVRMARALTPEAVTSDFVMADDNVATFFPTGITKPVAEFDLDVTTNPTSPYMIFQSSNARVWTLADVGGFRNFELQTGHDLVDATEFGMAWREHVAVLRGWSATAERFYIDENFTVDATGNNVDIDDMPVVVSFFTELDDVNDNYSRWIGLAEVEGVTLNVPVGELITSTVSFRGIGQLYFRRD